MTMRFRLSEVDCVTISGADHILKSQDADCIILQRLDANDICTSRSFCRCLAHSKGYPLKRERTADAIWAMVPLWKPRGACR